MGGRRTGGAGLPGGGQREGVTADITVINLSALAERDVLIWSPDADLLFTFSSKANPNQVFVSGNKNANLTNLIPEPALRNIGVSRFVTTESPFLLVSAIGGGPALVRYKPTSYWRPR